MKNYDLNLKDIFEYVKHGQLSSEEGFKIIKLLNNKRRELKQFNSSQKENEPSINSVDQNTEFSEHHRHEDIAVIGISCHFPDAKNISELWDNLSKGKDSIKEISSDRWKENNFGFFCCPNIHQSDYRWGGFISGIEFFDPLFFNISPREAELMDPQQRLFLQHAWKCIEDAGYCPNDLKKKSCGVFIGGNTSDYQTRFAENEDLDPYIITGNSSSILAARISYFLDLKGPSITIDTACSSSLIAAHLACESIRSGTCEIAIAGGVMIMPTPHIYINFDKAGMISPTRRCKTFDQHADGFVPGEGTGAILLKPLKKAINDEDYIYGVIKGSEINQDGKTNGITAPSALSQQELECKVYDKYNINPESITYIETHGTGTKLGDPIEIQALTNAFRKYTAKNQFCAIGSIKTNIGHTLASAGIAGLIKVLLCLDHKKIPASLHFKRANEYIKFEQSPFYVNTQFCSWTQKNDFPRRAAVSSFGFSGTNCHMIVEEAPDRNRKSSSAARPLYFLPFSARDKKALNRKFKSFRKWMNQCSTDFEIGDLAYTLLLGRSHFSVRCALIVKNIEDLKNQIDTLASGKKVNGLLLNDITSAKLNEEPSLKELGHHLINELNDLTTSNHNYRQKIRALADLYTKGYHLPWKILYEKNNYLRLPLPTYPFAENRYWISSDHKFSRRITNSPKNTEFHKLHPLLGTNISNLNQTGFTTRFKGNEFFISHHMINDDKILPAVAFIEMMRAAGQYAAVSSFNLVKNLIWLRPVIIKDNETDVSIDLSPSSDFDEVNLEINSIDVNERKLLHAQGSICYNTSIEKKHHPVDLNKIIDRCPNKFNGNQCYEQYHKIGLHLGPSFRVLKDIYVNETEVLAKLILPEDLEDSSDEFMLHPSIMDGCLQSAIGFSLLNKTDPILYVPFSMGEVHILHALPKICYAHLNLLPNRPSAHTENRNIDASIFDENGNRLIKMKDISARPFKADRLHLRNNKNNVAQKLSNIYFKSVWVDQKIDHITNELTHKSVPILVLDKNRELFLAIRNFVKNNFSSEQAPHVFLLKPGPSFKRTDQFIYQLNFHSIQEYTKLFQDIILADSQHVYVVHNLCEPISPDLDKVLNRTHHLDRLNDGIFTLFYLIRALISHDTPVQNNYNFVLLYSGSKNGTLPEYAAMNGFAKSVALENSKFWFKSVQLKYDDSDSSILTSPQIAEIIIKEFGCSTADSNEIRYYNNKRWINYWKTFNLKKPPVDILPFKENGVYLITGGLGGLGSILSEYIVTKIKTNLILTGRSDLDSEKEKKLKQLNSTGSNVIYIKSNLSDFENVEQLIQKIKSHFRSIDGIFHIAGIAKDALIQNKKRADFEEVLNPKIIGTLNLDLATKNEPLDFFVLFSSFSSITGNLGQCDYSYANCFINHYVDVRENLRKTQKRFGKSFSILWPLWKEGGLKVNKTTEKFFEDYHKTETLDAETGLTILNEILTSDCSKVLVVRRDNTKNDIVYFSEINSKIDRIDDFNNKSCIAEKGNPLFNQFKQDVLKIIARLTKLQVNHIDLKNNLTTYGFDSISFGEFSVLLNKKFNFVISPAKFFEYPSIDSFSQHTFQEYYQTIELFYRKNAKSYPSLTRIAHPNRKPDSVIIESNYTKNNFDGINMTGTLNTEPIAIIGMSCMMPHSDNPESFWDNLVAGKNLISQIPEERFEWGRFKEVLAREGEFDMSFDGGFMNDITKFDPSFFKISPHEAELMDPQQRIFLEIVWKTIEDAGHRVSELSGSNTGLFVGVSSADYADIIGKQVMKIESHFATGLSHSVLANRISYFFNFHGPSEPIDTACSSSLIAVHRAFQEIQNGNCDLAIAGGVNVLLNPAIFISFKKAGMLSDDGQCKAFDQNANGYVRGEGAGAVLLKPLKRAIKDGNHIYAVIKASGANHGGHAASLTAPNMIAQSNLLIDIYKKANCDPATISYIEAHGTGTRLGDPIEIDGLKRAFSAFSRKSTGLLPNHQKYCGIGSVKTNIGHLEAAAGIASLLKVLLALKHKKIPPNLNFNKLNAYIDLNESPFYIVTEAQKWNKLKDLNANFIPRRAGISSFGFGGSNAHILVEEYQLDKSFYNPILFNPQIFIFSAKNENSLAAYVHKIIAFISRFEDFGPTNCDGKSFDPCAIETTLLQFNEIAYTLQVGREPFEKRLAVIASNFQDLVDRLNQYLSHNIDEEFIFSGNFIKNNLLAELFSEEIEGKEFLDKIIRGKKLVKLAKLWVSGIAVDWSLLYDGQPPRRIPLPTYAFSRTRYWYNANYQNLTPDIADNNACQCKQMESDAIHDTLSALEPKSRKEFLISYLIQNISNLLKMGPDQQLSSKTALVSIGLDSLMALKLKQHIETAMCIDMSVINLLGDENIENIASQILNHFEHDNLAVFSKDQSSYQECQPNDLIEGVL